MTWRKPCFATSIIPRLNAFKTRILGLSLPKTTEPPPLKLELFSADQRAEHGRMLAGLHKLKTGWFPRGRLMARLTENETLLLKIHDLLTKDVEANRIITPAGEWLLDNFYVIETQIWTARRHLPENYSRGLPHLANTLSVNLPRVYDIALAAITHGDGRMNAENLSDIVTAYQSIANLNLGELWALPIMLRLALIEKLRLISVQMISNRLERIKASYWADQMTLIARENPEKLILIIADMARSLPGLTNPFVAELSRRLRGLGPALTLPLTWVEGRLAETSRTIDQLINTENNLQAINQVSISNCIGSLRNLDTMNWLDFVEKISQVEMILAQDPSQTYKKMDFATRDRYRHVVEKLAKYSSLSEKDIAEKAIELAKEAATQNSAPNRSAHVGFYLIDDGLEQLEMKARIRKTGFKALVSFNRHFAQRLYGSAIIILSALFSAILMFKFYSDTPAIGTFIFMVPVIIMGIGHMVIALINGLVTLLITPVHIPRMDFSKGLPNSCRTLVVIPTILTNPSTVEKLLKDLEVRFLANQDPQLHFALLSDFSDAETKELPEDEIILRLAESKTKELNKKYQNQFGDIFFLFHRPRIWNKREEIWMGRERKRGKLSDLNNFLRKKSKKLFSSVVGNPEILATVKYIITLDTDTGLARDTARKFVEAMAHPLNQPIYNPDLRRIVKGYGILQPRVTTGLSGTERSRYGQIYTEETCLDPYTRTTSDVYQDLFGEGSFIGKGIYNLDAFERTLNERFPDNRILSHDLLEGCYARSGLISDVQLYEESPTRYQSDILRRLRWIRGDWQIAGWIFPKVPGWGSKRSPNTLSWLSRWKILDNLRRSLTTSVFTLLLIAGWSLTFSPCFWTVTVISLIMIPSLVPSFLNALKKSEDMTFAQHLSLVFKTSPRYLIQIIFSLACLPYEAAATLKTIGTALWRINISHHHALQWQPSAEVDRQSQTNLSGFGRRMAFAPLTALAIAALLTNRASEVWLAAGPILCLWLASPLIAWWISKPLIRHKKPLSDKQTIFLRQLAHKTWSFFTTFVGPDDHWLPPDNYQEHPVAKVAHRTSPTNIGLSLLANLAAYDFGAITLNSLCNRTASTFQTLNTLKRYRGHFFNWYDTISLEPLPPLYISTVDSGNLAGHLLVLRAGLLEIGGQKILTARVYDGLNDLLGLIQEATKIEAGKNESILLARMKNLLTSVTLNKPTSLIEVRRILETLTALSRDLIIALELGAPNLTNESLAWTATFRQQNLEILEELDSLTPWIGAYSNSTLLNCFPELDQIMTLQELAALPDKIGPEIENRRQTAIATTEIFDIKTLKDLILTGGRTAETKLASLEKLAVQCDRFSRMEFDFLYNENRHLLTIGYNVETHRLDSGYYDLLASEARLTSFIGIALGTLSQDNWFALGRILTGFSNKAALLSWSGSMFEYLMPLLVMPTYENTLLDETNQVIVARQIEYGHSRSVPWGISECGYNAFDASLAYQYGPFGVPGLGLKRGLATDLVIAPYASFLALMVAPQEATVNLLRMETEGFMGRYGFYEAVDYTPARVPQGHSFDIVRSFMVHHQGMSLLALAYHLLNHPMQRRFTNDPALQSTLLLLQEKIPVATAVYTHISTNPEFKVKTLETPLRIIRNPNLSPPEVQLLAGSNYQVMITSAGGGYSRWRNLAVTRWREDSTRDHWGQFCYLRDEASGEFWSTAYQPTLKPSKKYEAIFSEGRVEFNTQNHNYETRLEIVVSPEDDLELRRLHITNRARTSRILEVTSYGEIVLAPPLEDASHPAFSNLFIETEALLGGRAILATRRPRSDQETTPWMLHMMTVHGTGTVEFSYETDRLKFIGRTGNLSNPAVMKEKSGPLEGGIGSVLDPIMAIRSRITLGIEQSIIVDLVTGVAETREAAVTLSEKYCDRHIADRVFKLAWTHGQVLLRHLSASEADAHLFNRLAGSVLYAHETLRAPENILIKNHRGQSGLWGYAISGDLPIVLLIIGDQININLAHQMLRAHEYWRRKGLIVDLVIINEDQSGYRQILHDQIMNLIAAGSNANLIDRPGGVFLRAGDRIAEEDRILIQTVARVIINDDRGDLADQSEGLCLKRTLPPPLVTIRPPFSEPPLEVPQPRLDLSFFNSLGGFTPDGREYVITTAPGQITPAPWVNILANPTFGSIVSESGSSSTFSENAHEFRLTPWDNDPVSDSSGEAFYLRDEESGQFWSPLPWPCRGTNAYVTRHGFGYSIFEHTEAGLYSETQIYVALDAAVKIICLKVRNVSGRTRRFSATGYIEWVLGDFRFKSGPQVVTEIDLETGAILVSNSYNSDFPGRTGFFDVEGSERSVTCDRLEFLGPNGCLTAPAAMLRTKLSGRAGAALDQCAAAQTIFKLTDGEEREVVFKLGMGSDRNEALDLIHRFRKSNSTKEALDKVWQHWNHTLGAVNVETPDPSFNLMANGWLLYQTLACRLWARGATYQSGGAFGFRDQLQDVAALIHTRPSLAREHLLLCAAHQFTEGDVQHWWHPPLNRGVRTKCSDDYLWLPLILCRYVEATSDTEILNEPVHFLVGRRLKADENSYYDLPDEGEEANLYEHCLRAIRYGLKFGVHGLPLIGSGDWNDGFDQVGKDGFGESVWLGFILYEVLTKFTSLAHLRQDQIFYDECRSEAAKLRLNLATHGWDGSWYRRAYFDDGSALGSAVNSECRIDSIAQSWSVLSGAGESEYTTQAMEALSQYLVDRDQALVKLLTPPFNVSEPTPGYIKGYLPGVRENGGQYTHAAIWAGMAFASLGSSHRAWEIFNLINPINHTTTIESLQVYKVEPYVMAADVYATSPHAGRGGWTWYTGSAAWMYRFMMESLLGITLKNGYLSLKPLFPAHWKEFKVHYRFRETVYHITVRPADLAANISKLTLDGRELENLLIPLIDDHLEHWVTVEAPYSE